jgi:hypothetical protein
MSIAMLRSLFRVSTLVPSATAPAVPVPPATIAGPTTHSPNALPIVQRICGFRKVWRGAFRKLWRVAQGSESINAKVQKIKAAACGFRNRKRFINMIVFHLGDASANEAAA